MGNKVPKNFRLSVDTINKLEDLQNVSDKGFTEIIENAVRYIHGEYMRSMTGKERDNVMLSQVLGKTTG